ncbi:MAG: hypothetical protein HY652_15005 [Acidobacteria bacterium]|nr:hypothetical protein [Acidobacteriota bacterium]
MVLIIPGSGPRITKTALYWKAARETRADSRFFFTKEPLVRGDLQQLAGGLAMAINSRYHRILEARLSACNAQSGPGRNANCDAHPDHSEVS